MKNMDQEIKLKSSHSEFKSKAHEEEQQKILSERAPNIQYQNDQVDFMDLQADISIALTHNYANKYYKIDYQKLHETSVETCICCCLPTPKENYVEEFSFKNNIEELSQAGIGIYLYLLFIRFSVISLFVLIGMNSVIQSIVSLNYYNILNTYCTNSSSPSVLGNCTNFNLMKDDWMFKMSSQNVRFYVNITQSVFPTQTNLEILDFPFMNFLCMMVLLSINYFYLILLKNFVIQYRFENISPSNFTLIISNIPTNLSVDELKKELTIGKIEPIHINQTYKIDAYCQLKEKYHSFQRKLDFCNLNKQSFYEVNGCCLCCEGCEGIGCCSCLFKQNNESISLITNKQAQVKQEMDDLMMEFKNKNNIHTIINGVAFVTFNTENEARIYLKQFPASIFGFCLNLIRYIGTNLIFSWCLSEKTKKDNKKRIKYIVTQAHEPEEIYWQNLQFGVLNRFFRKIIAYASTLIFLGILLAFVYGINVAQGALNSKYKGVNYLLSFIIACVIQFVNYSFNNYLLFLVEFERVESITDFHLSHSFKLSIISFITSGIIPLLANVINGYYYLNQEILLNEIFMIFIFNNTLSLLMYIYSPLLCYKNCFRKNLISKYTYNMNINLNQRQVTELFNNPQIEFSSKYAYIGKTLLLTFFYLPIFPVGSFLSCFGLLIFYLIEKYNIVRVYRPSELINEKLTHRYLSFFKGCLLLYSISTYIFLSDVFMIWSRVCLITFCILQFIPFHNFLIPNLVHVSEEEMLTENYKETYPDFSTDYERTNPLTRKVGLEKYFNNLHSSGEIDKNVLKSLLEELDSNETFFLEDFFNNNFSQGKTRETFENKYYAKTVFQSYYDSSSKNNEEKFKDKNFFYSFIKNESFSARKFRHNKKIFIKGKILAEKRQKEFEILLNKSNQLLGQYNTNGNFDNQSEFYKNYNIPDHNQLENNERNTMSYNGNPKSRYDSTNNSKIKLKNKNNASNASKINDEND